MAAGAVPNLVSVECLVRPAGVVGVDDLLGQLDGDWLLERVISCADLSYTDTVWEKCGDTWIETSNWNECMC